MYYESSVTIEQVEKMEEPSRDFLCPLEANIYGLQFTHFKMRDVTSNLVLYEVRKPQEAIGMPVTQNMRTVRYRFGPVFFQLENIGTTLEFKVGSKPVKNFTMIERHYFKNQLIKSYKFQVPFCIPNGTNSMQAVYELPPLPEETILDMINSPWETVSDSFYFVEGKLVMQTKALYSYEPLEDE